MSTSSPACGIDVGGTQLAGGVFDAEGRIVEEFKVESPAEDIEAVGTPSPLRLSNSARATT